MVFADFSCCNRTCKYWLFSLFVQFCIHLLFDLMITNNPHTVALILSLFPLLWLYKVLIEHPQLGWCPFAFCRHQHATASVDIKASLGCQVNHPALCRLFELLIVVVRFTGLHLHGVVTLMDLGLTDLGTAVFSALKEQNFQSWKYKNKFYESSYW